MRHIWLFGALVGVLVIGCGGSDGNSADMTDLYSQSVAKMAILAPGVLLYASDNDDVLPPKDTWMQVTDPYIEGEDVFRSPGVEQGYGYALNALLAGKGLGQIDDQEGTPMLFDSTDTSYNATAALDTLPDPPRYGSKNTIGYVDGHVQDYDQVPDYDQWQESQKRLKQVALGMLMYSSDWDDVAPLATNWTDGLSPYVKRDGLFRSPAVEAQDPNAYGYGFHDIVAGKNLLSFESPATTISFFDSTVLTRNATVPTSTLPEPPRYPEGNTIAFLDGHAGGVEAHKP